MDYAPLIQSGETDSLEFKTSFNQETIEAVVALANHVGGQVIVGVKPNKKIVGVEDNEELAQRWINEIKSKTDPPQIPDIKIESISGKKVVVIEVPECQNKPVAVQRRYFIRRANSNHLMTSDEISNCRLQTQNTSWDYVLDERGDINRLDLDKVNLSVKRINERGYHIKENAPIEFLEKCDLLRDGKVSFAAEMLFSKSWNINTTIEMGFFQDAIIIKDRLRSQGDLVSQESEVFEFVKKHINCAVVISGKLENDLVWDYPLDAIREIILNMIVHRDYRSPSDSVIKIYRDHIEFFNPGKCLGTSSIDNLISGKYTSKLRNKAIAHHFYMLGEIEKYGSGISRIMAMFKESGNPSPAIELMEDGFKITIYARKDDAVNKVVNKVVNKSKQTGAKEVILKAIKNMPGTSTQGIIGKTGYSRAYIIKIIAILKEENLIEYRGSKKTGGYYYIGKK